MAQVKFGLSTENLRSYVPKITKETVDFLSNELHLSSTKWQSFDVLHALSELTILTASGCLQGKEVRSSLDKTFARRYEALDRGFTPLNFMFPNLPLPSYRARDKAQREMSEFYQAIIRKRREGTHDVSSGHAPQTSRLGGTC
jgi:sterol 14-demethylase